MRKLTCFMLILGLALPVASYGDGGNEKPVDSSVRPYIQVKTVPGEAGTVRVFFSPSCHFSRQYLPFFQNLANSLPANRQFVYSPVINKLDGVSYAMGFEAVQMYYPAYINNFIVASMEGIQDMGISTRKWDGLDRIGRAAHIPVPVSILVNKHIKQVEKKVVDAVKLQSALKITNTPSVAVDGTYIVTPEFVAGNPDMFSKLINALISMTE